MTSQFVRKAAQHGKTNHRSEEDMEEQKANFQNRGQKEVALKDQYGSQIKNKTSGVTTAAAIFRLETNQVFDINFLLALKA